MAEFESAKQRFGSKRVYDESRAKDVRDKFEFKHWLHHRKIKAQLDRENAARVSVAAQDHARAISGIIGDA